MQDYVILAARNKFVCGVFISYLQDNRYLWKRQLYHFGWVWHNDVSMVEVMETVNYFFDVSCSSKKEKNPFEKMSLNGLNDHSLQIG